MRAVPHRGPPTARELPCPWHRQVEAPGGELCLPPHPDSERDHEDNHGYQADESQHEAWPHADTLQPHERLPALGERGIHGPVDTHDRRDHSEQQRSRADQPEFCGPRLLGLGGIQRIVDVCWTCRLTKARDKVPRMIMEIIASKCLSGRSRGGRSGSMFLHVAQEPLHFAWSVGRALPSK